MRVVLASSESRLGQVVDMQCMPREANLKLQAGGAVPPVPVVYGMNTLFLLKISKYYSI